MSYIFLLYIGDVVQDMTITMRVLPIFASIGGAAWYAISAMNGDSYGNQDQWKEDRGPLRKKVAKIFTWCIACFVLAMFIPSKQFIYTAVAIKAGAEITEEVKKNPLVEKGFKVLEKYLDEELKTSNNK